MKKLIALILTKGKTPTIVYNELDKNLEKYIKEEKINKAFDLLFEEVKKGKS